MRPRPKGRSPAACVSDTIRKQPVRAAVPLTSDALPPGDLAFLRELPTIVSHRPGKVDAGISRRLARLQSAGLIRVTVRAALPVGAPVQVADVVLAERGAALLRGEAVA